MSYGTRIQHSNEPFELTLEEIEIHTSDGYYWMQDVCLTVAWSHGWPVIERIDLLACKGKKRKVVMTLNSDHDWFEGTVKEILRWDFNKTAIEDAYQTAVSALSEEEYA